MSVSAARNSNTEALANWISETPTISDQLALKRAKSAFIDTTACMLAAANSPVTNNVFDALRFSGSGICSVVGRAETLSAENAAVVNGTAAHALDFDDNFLPAVTHASAVLVPSLLALGEEVGASGDHLLDAYIVGLEVHAWLGRHMIPSHYAAGWHATSTIGAVGAAAACVRILALDNKSALTALSLATSMASGSKLQFGSMAKPLHAGLAARAGITSARLASSGVNANETPFEGPWGFISLHHSSHGNARPFKSELSIITDGLAQKKWPCCASAHRTLDAILDLTVRYNLKDNDIRSIETTIPDSNFQNLRFPHPRDADEARFSMPFCSAVMARDRTLSLLHFTPEVLQDSELAPLMKKVTMYSSGPAADTESGIWDVPATTTIITTDNQKISQSTLYPIGTIQNPMSENELYIKFKECAATLLSCERSDELFSRLTHFDKQKIRTVASLIRNREVSLAEKEYLTGHPISEGTISLGAKP